PITSPSKPQGPESAHQLALQAGAECLSEALRLHAKGWPVLALCPPDHVGVGRSHGRNCQSPGKAPLILCKQYQSELPTVEDVRGWWKQTPLANVGVARGGPGRLLRLDVDGPLGETELLHLSGGDLPLTAEFVSGRANGGRGLLYLILEGAVWKTAIE